MRTYLILVAMLFATGAGAQDSYHVNLIPDSLLENATVVLRMEELSFEIENPSEAKYTNRYAITVFNENGDYYAQLNEYYDKLKEIVSIEGRLFDGYGNEVRKLKKKEIQDLSGVDDNSLMDDHRRKVHSFYHRQYPYTVEYEIVTKYKNTLFFPTWAPQWSSRMSVQKSSFSVTAPQDYLVRYRAFNYAGEPEISTEKNKKRIRFSLTGLKSFVPEYASPGWNELTTMVYFGPSEFEIQGYKGNMESWKDFGRFVHSLKQGREQLPEQVKQKVKELTASVNDPHEKIRLLYEYLQKNTRYISIQLGIGGWQPFAADFVASKGYGDCKALTNYMYSLLKEAGITSYYSLIYAGRDGRDIIADFPSQQFNHVILAVPMESDTVWLECTSQTLPSGYLGGMTADRHALMIDESGGILVRTPRYGLTENLQYRKVQGKIMESGTLQASVQTAYTGIQQDGVSQLINNLSPDKVKEYLQEQLDFATYEIKDFGYSSFNARIPGVNEKLELEVSNYASITGKRIFVLPNVMTRSYRRLEETDSRKHQIKISFAYTDIDTVELELPTGYEPESVPEDIVITGPFGNYKSQYKIEGNLIRYYRSIEHFGGEFAPSMYNDLVKFYDKIYSADRKRVVLVKN